MTTIPASDIPVSIDYTGRDYYAIREQLIARVQDRVPTWTGNNTADFGLALIEAFSYLGDLMSYYIDRNANENSIFTATQRDSVINIAQTYGYIPSGYRSASTTLTFSNSSTDTPFTIPAGTVISGDVVIGDTVNTIYFTTEADVVSNPGVDNGTITVIAHDGRDVALVSTEANEYGEILGSSDGTPNQVYALLENPVVDTSVEVYVLEGDAYSKWRQVQHLIDYGPYDQVFSLSIDAENNVSVVFGDGVSGQIPPYLSDIRAKYIVGGGSLGNVVANTLTNIEYVPNLSHGDLVALQSYITVTNLDIAVGGSDPESLAQIRYSAPLTLRSNNRAVTLEDFRSIALSVAGKAKATANVWTSVTLYVAPTRLISDTDLAPGLDSMETPTVEFTALSADVLTALSGKTLIGTSVTVQPPTYVDVILNVAYTKLPQYTTTEVERNIKTALVTSLNYVNLDFGQTIHQQDIEYILNNSVIGLQIAKLTVLHRQGDSGLNTLVGDVGEIFRFQEGNISVGAM
jgi:hypothetical protein